MKLTSGRICDAHFIASPFYNERPNPKEISLLVIHNISLPPKKYGADYVQQLFTGTLDPNAHPLFEELSHYQVSSHFYIRRAGELMQFVSCDERAWHAGLSSFNGREACNDFSIGIELEGCDTDYFTIQQYKVLAQVTQTLIHHYPIETILGHSDIAPGRKTDPGPYFNWAYYLQCLLELTENETDISQLFNRTARASNPISALGCHTP